MQIVICGDDPTIVLNKLACAISSKSNSILYSSTSSTFIGHLIGDSIDDLEDLFRDAKEETGEILDDKPSSSGFTKMSDMVLGFLKNKGFKAPDGNNNLPNNKWKKFISDMGEILMMRSTPTIKGSVLMMVYRAPSRGGIPT